MNKKTILMQFYLLIFFRLRWRAQLWRLSTKVYRQNNFISSIFGRSDKNSVETRNVCKKGKMKIYARFHPQLLQNGCKIRPAVILVLRRNGAWREGWNLFLNIQISEEDLINERVVINFFDILKFPRYQISARICMRIAYSWYIL